MRYISRGVIAIAVFIVVSLFMPIVEISRITEPDFPGPITGGWSSPIVIFFLGAYSSISQFQDRYSITESISHASTLPFLLLIMFNILLLIVLMIRKTSPKAAFPVSLLILISWIWLSFQIYAVLEDWIVRPILITPLVGSILTLLFIDDIESLRKLLGFND